MTKNCMKILDDANYFTIRIVIYISQFGYSWTIRNKIKYIFVQFIKEQNNMYS